MFSGGIETSGMKWLNLISFAGVLQKIILETVILGTFRKFFLWLYVSKFLVIVCKLENASSLLDIES